MLRNVSMLILTCCIFIATAIAAPTGVIKYEDIVIQGDVCANGSEFLWTHTQEHRMLAQQLYNAHLMGDDKAVAFLIALNLNDAFDLEDEALMQRDEVNDLTIMLNIYDSN